MKCDTDRILRINQVTEMVGLGRTTIYDAMARGDFPKNFKIIGRGRASGWRLSDVQDFIRDGHNYKAKRAIT